MGNPKAMDNGSLSESKSAIDHRSGAEVQIEDNEAAKASSIPNAGTVVNHTKGVSLDNGDIFKDGSQAADVPTGNTCKMPTRNEKSPTREKEVTTAAETLELADSFLELEIADGNSANEDLVAAEALAYISLPRPEDKAVDPTSDLNVASKVKETQKVFKLVPPALVKMGGSKEADADPYAMGALPEGQQKPMLKPKEV
jgi:hypothetical protein